MPTTLLNRRQRRRHEIVPPGLFDKLDDTQSAISEAERELLNVANFAYAHTSLKPISKTLFLISRCLFILKVSGTNVAANDLTEKYAAGRRDLGNAAPDDDFDFREVVDECADHLPQIINALRKVVILTEQIDGLGLAFNTLLRGKFEAGEGMGTFLTPEEVVNPMVDILLQAVGDEHLNQMGGMRGLLYGDICGGTGRFVYAIARRLEKAGVTRRVLQSSARLFDQSRMAVDFGRLNFLFDGMKPNFQRVGDSLTAPEVSDLRSRFLFLATNPPFGAGKYRRTGALARDLHPEILQKLGLRQNGDSADPSAVFVFRNLDLLAVGGALAIVLPDGVAQSDYFKDALVAYESVCGVNLNVSALVSLPVATFSLGGTIAKTSFVIIQKVPRRQQDALYLAVSHHVGFLKRGNKRIADPAGSDLAQIALEFGKPKPTIGERVGCWREHDSFAVARIMHAAKNRASSHERRLSELVDMVRQFENDKREPESRFHVSILDVDQTGLIDIIAASRNQPTSKGLVCRPGDVLVSCLNPKIWRVAVIPNLSGIWSCSAEFAVLRPRDRGLGWRIAIGLHQPGVAHAIQAMAKGTSSSRQRVPKDRILAVGIPDIKLDRSISQHFEWRDEFYRKRLCESALYDAVHSGGDGFTWRG